MLFMLEVNWSRDPICYKQWCVNASIYFQNLLLEENSAKA